MIRYTEDNTEGFSAADLATLNAAHGLIAAAEPGMDEKSIDDAIANAFIDGMTVDRLVAAALGRPGAV